MKVGVRVAQKPFGSRVFSVPGDMDVTGDSEKSRDRSVDDETS
jgi:hypothetical protein